MLSKNSKLSINNAPDNQQETKRVPHNFYYTGFCIGELSCCLIKASNKGKGFYFTPDITISNQDKNLLQDINLTIASSIGVISPIKGGYNLKFRGKRRVKSVLNFFKKYPVIAGDIAQQKLELIENSLPAIGKNSKVQDRFNVIERCRKELKDLKLCITVKESMEACYFSEDEIGFFIVGVIDAEGSFGLKKSGQRLEPFFAIAMKDQKIIELIQKFLICGNIHKRSDDGLYHFETNRRLDILRLINLFTNKYPSRLKKMRERMGNLKRILNDYTPGSRIPRDYNIV